MRPTGTQCCRHSPSVIYGASAPAGTAVGIDGHQHRRGTTRCADDILATFGVTLARTQRELQGHPCMELEEVEPDRQQIMVSRSFADRVEDHDAVAQALATFAIRACEKLRARGLVTAGYGCSRIPTRSVRSCGSTTPPGQ